MDYSQAGAPIGPLKSELFTAEPDLRLAFTGELDLAGVAEAQTTLLDALALGRTLSVDLSGLSFIDSAGLGMLVRAAEANGLDDLRFHGPLTPPVGRLLALTGMDDVLQVAPAAPLPVAAPA